MNSASTTSTAVQAPGKLRILLVEDVDMIAQVVEFLVQRAECDFLRGTNGEEGVTLATTERPDLILMDLQMPVMDGIEATRRIREWEASQEGHLRIPIYAFTAKCAAGQETLCLDSGFDGFFSKPLGARDFLAFVETMAAKKNSPPSSET